MSDRELSLRLENIFSSLLHWNEGTKKKIRHHSTTNRPSNLDQYRSNPPLPPPVRERSPKQSPAPKHRKAVIDDSDVEESMSDRVARLQREVAKKASSELETTRHDQEAAPEARTGGNTTRPSKASTRKTAAASGSAATKIDASSDTPRKVSGLKFKRHLKPAGSATARNTMSQTNVTEDCQMPQTAEHEAAKDDTTRFKMHIEHKSKLLKSVQNKCARAVDNEEQLAHERFEVGHLTTELQSCSSQVDELSFKVSELSRELAAKNKTEADLAILATELKERLKTLESLASTIEDLKKQNEELKRQLQTLKELQSNFLD